MASHSDIERELYTIFNEHPNSHVNESGEPVIPADALVDVFRSFSDVFNDPLLSDEETDMLKTLLANNPGLEVTPSILLQFIAEKTRHSPSPDHHDDEPIARGRDQERNTPSDHHRSSSNESAGAPYYQPSSGSRPPSRGPPQTPFGRSPFDLDRRQRSTPLANAPSSWTGKRPAPAARRRSIDGSRSDSEYSTSPTTFTRSTSGRVRTPSNPTSPSSISADLNNFSPIGSPTFSNSFSRPRSRAGSQSASAYTQTFGIFGSPGPGNHDPDDDTTINSSGNYEYRNEDSFGNTISSLPMPTSALDSDSDDEEDSSLGLVLDRNFASSTASLEPMERLEALQRVNTDLGRKLMEAERTLQNKLGEHESELEEMQSKLEEMRSELSATKREEKELRSKERQNITQISALELEVAKVTKALEHAKSTYASLQRQYQEQCTASEKYRDDLRHREEIIRSLREAASLHEVEMGKWSKEQQSYEDRIIHLEAELNVAQQAHAQLDEQKQENLLLKETIDRMRFEMDDMRSTATLGLTGGSGGGSGANTFSKSLGAELMGKMKWNEEEEEMDNEDDVERDEDEGGTVTVVEHEDEDTDGEEDVIQTIITRKKRKVASRAKTIETRTFEEVREYSDSAVQYDPTLFCVSNGIQTIAPPQIPTATHATQTESATTRTYAIQTDPKPEAPPKVTLEMEIQTDRPLEEDSSVAGSGSVSPLHVEGEESLASSSSTIIPPTPKAHLRALSVDEHGLPTDSPPTYHQAAAQRREEEEKEKESRVTRETLKRWHWGAQLRSLHGQGGAHSHVRLGGGAAGSSTDVDGETEGEDKEVLDIDFDPLQGGVPEDLVDDWKGFKEELGVECLVIDRILENSEKIPSTSPRTDSSTSSSKAAGKSRSGRFYNIYNTYVYGSSSSTKGISATLTQLATQTLIFASASAVVFVALAPYLPYLQHQNVPGGATMYDRAAWASYNSLGGGGGEGIAFAASTAAAAGGAGVGRNINVVDGQATEAVWKVLGLVGNGAARIARGWPT